MEAFFWCRTLDARTVELIVNIMEVPMSRKAFGTVIFLGFLGAGLAMAGDKKAEIANAESAGPASVTANATIKAGDGTILRDGSNGYTCYPQQDTMGPMCNEAPWDALIDAMMNKKEFEPKELSISYMLAGEGTAIGVSNSDPYATDPKSSDDWVKEGPHLMIIVPDRAMLEGMSRDPKDPVYVMWGDTPYAHVMVRISDE
jgi:hypothetical protein